MVIEAMQNEPDAEGFFISGFPRDIVQAQGFEERVSVYIKGFPYHMDDMGRQQNVGIL